MTSEQDDPVTAYLKAKAAAQQPADGMHPSTVAQSDATRVGPGSVNPGARQLTGAAKVASDVFEHGIPFTPIPGAADFADPRGLIADMGMLAGGEVAGAALKALAKSRVGRVAQLVAKRLPGVKPVVRAIEETRPGPVPTPQAKGLLSRAIDNLDDAAANVQPLGQRPGLNDLYNAEAAAVDALQSRGMLTQAAGKAWKPRSAPKARFDWFAEQMARRKP